jgi:hypothetical protein
MSLDGLRAWIGEVERKLGMRTRVFLALTVIAIGIGGAAVYLAIDARESSVSQDDVQALQQQLETRIDELAAAPATAPAETEPEPSPKPEAQPEVKPEGASKDGNGAGKGAVGGIPESATGGGASAAKLQELLEAAKEKQAAGE